MSGHTPKALRCAYANDKFASEERWVGRFEHSEKLRDEGFWNQLEPPKDGLPGTLVGRQLLNVPHESTGAISG